MVNILTWCNIRKKFRITVETNIERTINIHVKKDKIVKLKEIESGLYICYAKDPQKNNNIPFGRSFLNFLTENMSNFTKSQIRQAEKARKLIC